MAFLDKLKAGLAKTKNAILGQVDNVLKAFVRVDEDLLDELEELLICADVGVGATEDIIEELVGEIWDESDEEIDNISKIGENSYKVLCTTSTEDFFEFFELEPDEISEATTVNGWLIEKSENIPEDGYTIDYENITITVTKSDELMTHEIRVDVKEQTEETDEEESEEQ